MQEVLCERKGFSSRTMPRTPPSQLLDELSSTAPANAVQPSSEYLGTATDRRRTWAVFAFLAAIVLLLFGRAFDLQALRGRALRGAADRNRTRIEVLLPTRGIISDRNGVPLVRNALSYAIGIIPVDLGIPRDVSTAAIARAFGEQPDVITELLNQYPVSLAAPIILRDRLMYDDAVRLTLALNQVAGIRLLVAERREYRGPDGHEWKSLSHVIGYVGRISAQEYEDLSTQRYQPSDGIGKNGIEASYESRLRGVPGIRIITVDARGRTVGVDAVEPPRAGSALMLTIDYRIQKAVEIALQAGMRSSGSRRGAAIALDAATGEVFALVSLPAFSATAIAQGISTDEYSTFVNDADLPLFPRAMAGLYPSGSTIKPFLAAAALVQGTITPTTRIWSSGGISVQGSFFPDWKPGGHGSVDVRRALADSVNTFFYVIGGGWPTGISNLKSSTYGGSAVGGQISNTAIRPLGPDGIADALRRFGFGQTTGIDIAGEREGLVPTPEWKRRERDAPWYIGDTYHFAIGQGDLLVTPLQLARSTATIANGGTLVTPHLIRDRVSDEPKLEGLDVSYAEALDIVRSGMRLAVTQGSARQLAGLPFTVFGKTGTAQTDNLHRPHAWFTGFAEIHNQRIVVTVLIEEGGEGSAVAVPVAREIFSAWAGTL